MTEAMSILKFSSKVFRVLNKKKMTEKTKKMTEKTKKMTEASASLCLILATALVRSNIHFSLQQFFRSLFTPKEETVL